MRYFDTGATRDSDDSKIDPEGFLNPLCVEAFSDYMNIHRVQADGCIRDSDNWQKGMPRSEYLKSMLRHVLDLWKLHRGFPAKDRKTGKPISKQEACCAIWFNVQGYLWETLREELGDVQRQQTELEDDHRRCVGPGDGGVQDLDRSEVHAGPGSCGCYIGRTWVDFCKGR